MFKFTFSSPSYIGLERTGSSFKMACLSVKSKKPVILRLSHFLPEELASSLPDPAIITTGIESKQLLIRPLHLPLTKEKDILAALPFQAEPFLPYPVEDAPLNYQLRSKASDGTDITLFSTRKETLKTHLEEWQQFGIEPERVDCIPNALNEFAKNYLPPAKNYLVLHVGRQMTTCVLTINGTSVASFAEPIGLDLLVQASPENFSPENQDWQTLELDTPALQEALTTLQRSLVKMGLALSKELRGEAIEGVVMTGEAVTWNGMGERLVQLMNLPLHWAVPTGDFSSHELQNYAVPIGLALGSLPGIAYPINFRQGELAYPYPWKHLKASIMTYFLLTALLSTFFYLFTQHYLDYREEQLKSHYIDLLSHINKSHTQFENEFTAKNKSARPANTIADLNQEDLRERLAFVQRNLREMPDSIPLYPNIPLVSDLLAWLAQHPNVTHRDDQDGLDSRIKIENLSYALVKRPQQGKKLEKYQVKVELEFTSPTPKWAREFHDALISPNDWIDPKGEVKWNSNRGSYKTSFFLKDKTLYPT